MPETKDLFVASEKLLEFSKRCFEKLGLPEEDAELTAQALIWTSLRGVDSHGVIRLKAYADRLRAGGVNPLSPSRVVKEGPTFALVDGGNGVGQVVSMRAMKLAVEKAEEAGIAVVGVRNSSHFGAAAFYPLMTTEGRGMIAFASTNAGPTMAPWFGNKQLLGNNPLCLTVPAHRFPPLVLDMATGAVAWGKIFNARAEGKKIPPGWALDKYGRPTDDPVAATDGGFIQPLGGYKGYGLCLMMDILCGVLTGSGFATSVTGLYRDQRRPQNIGHFFGALKIDCFMPVDEFCERVDELIALMKECPRIEGEERVYVPGEIEHETEQERKRTGIPVNSSLREELAALSQELGVELPFLECF